jgi:hypothetical protein
VFFWFLGAVVAAVWIVFHDTAIDYRLVLLGAVLPDLIDAPFGGARVMHSVTASVALLAIVMLATIGRRPLRRRLLALVIGVFLHLVVDGAWTDAKVFWWPFGGLSFDDAPLPSVARGWWNVPLELIGLGVLAWFWRRFRLADAARRDALVRTGHLDRSLA